MNWQYKISMFYYIFLFLNYSYSRKIWQNLSLIIIIHTLRHVRSSSGDHDDQNSSKSVEHPKHKHKLPRIATNSVLSTNSIIFK